MQHLNLFQQIVIGLWSAGLCLILQALIWNFKYIWTVELGNGWFGEGKTA